MDRSSRRIVTFIAVVTIIVMAAMATRSYLDADQSTTAAPVVETNDDAAPEAPKREPSENVTDTSDEMPVAAPDIEDIPAITGEPSMTFESENSEARESTAPENDE